MKIQTTNLKEFKKIFDLTRIAGNAYYEHIYLDFEKEVLTFMNDSAIVRIKLFIDDKDEKQENIFVDGTKFFFLVSTFDYLIIKGKSFYSPQNNKFILQTLDEELELPEVKEYEWKQVVINFTEEFNKYLAISKDYLEITPETSLFFEKGYMISLSENRFFQANAKIDPESSFDIPIAVVKIIENLHTKIEDSCILRYRTKNRGKIYEILYKDLVYNFSSPYNTELPIDPFNPDFIASFKHDNFFELDLKTALENVSTLDSYVSDSSSSHCEIKFFEDSLVFYLKNEGEVEYRQPVEFYSDFEKFREGSFWISLNRLKIALSSLNTKRYEKIKIRYNLEEDMIYFSSKEETGDMFIVQTLLEKPNNN